MNSQTESAEKPEEEKRIVKPGWYLDMTNEDYHKSFGFSSSNVKKLCEKTPAHLDYDRKHPKDPTENMKLGTLVHTLVLEPEKFESEYIVKPSSLKKPTAAQLSAKKPSDKSRDQMNAWAAFMKASEGKEVIDQLQYDMARQMADNVLNHPVASLLVKDVVVESSIYWWYKNRDPDDETEYKMMAKVRPDAIHKIYDAVIDLKTCVDGSYTGFQRAIMRYYYHLSAAMYLDGVNQCKELLTALNKFAYTKFVFVCVESEPPHLVSVYELDRNALELGKQLYRRGMLHLWQGKENDWPAFPEDIRILELPGYAERLHIV